ncbi:hypothetical protein JMY81_01045 [Brenneria goodwinii]|uniref:hypothetical protein n=1 Tax=Brenneria goodwinii TaxID=1109412 RepID=UPI000EF1B2D2|nr:hypothetical protein [Brenneria goodwinii]MCG8155183.1 hypothetical protein [Brenneria goodwinii]MCG8159427.1 hypothetical protein [Brenneria goodwinii]MCG8164404.1 hypothetical protein [Brenneria goodwinii]MCG8169030.1 hypothetical protein [Brenneria goodwinii]MCG8173286.1 hypothetical protein [Brenneria goodwinii]
MENKTEKPTLESFLKKAFDADYIDLGARVYLADGKVAFYIHENGHDSETLDFRVNVNSLELIAHT